MANSKSKHRLNYYFLNQFLHPKPYPGYKQSVLSLIINQNEYKTEPKFLFVKEKIGFWFFPKGRITGHTITDNFFDGLSQSLENEFGMRGMNIFDAKPQFTQIAYLFDFERQEYNPARQLAEEKKGNPTKGKIYHIAIMGYSGTEDQPSDSRESKILERRWVTKNEAEKLLDQNNALALEYESYTEGSHAFYKRFYEKLMYANAAIQDLRKYGNITQTKLF